MNRTSTFTRLELLAVLAALALLGALALPAVTPVRQSGHRVTCVNNLRQIARGWLMWAGEHGGSAPPTVNPADGGTKGNQNLYAHFLVASNEIGSPRVLVCPSDTKQWIATDWLQFDSPPFRNNAVGYFAGMHVSVAGNPASILLAGDPNLQGVGAQNCGLAVIRAVNVLWNNASLGWFPTGFHQGTGNAAFGDGCVLQLTSDGLRQKLRLPAFNDDNGAGDHILLPP